MYQSIDKSDREFVEHWRRFGPWLERFRELEDRVCDGRALIHEVVAFKSLRGFDDDWADVREIVSHQRSLEWCKIHVILADLCQLRGDQSPVTRLAAIRREVDENR